MAKKKWFDEEVALNTPWDGDESTENLPVRGTRVEELIKKHLNKPLHQIYDGNSRLYRYFAEEQWANECKLLIDQGEPLTLEVLNHQVFADPAPAPYVVQITDIKDGVNILEGTKGTYLQFGWMTTNDSGVPLQERVDTVITFTNKGSSQQIRTTYAIGQKANILIDDYLKPGLNEITVIVTGLMSGETGRVTVVYNVISLGLSSLFQVAQSRTPNETTKLVTLDIDYTAWGGYDKYVEFYIDSQEKPAATQYWPANHNPSKDGATNDLQTISQLLSPGKHMLQIRLRVDFNETPFYSNTLGYEFVVTGELQSHVTMAFTVPNGRIISSSDLFSLNVEQYKEALIIWGYYTSALAASAVVEWKTKDSEGNYTVIGSRNATTMDATNNVAPDPLKFSPDKSGEFTLEAWVGENMLASYRLIVSPNSMGINKSPGIIFEVSAMGRSDDEPASTIDTWVSKVDGLPEYYCTFHGSHNWKDDALILEGVNNWAEFNIAPLVNPTERGFTFEITFETFSTDDEEAPVIQIGNYANGEGCIMLCGKEAKIKSASNTILKTQYNNNDRLKQAYIINPNAASKLTNEPEVMFIQTEGVRERATSYASSDTFNSPGRLIIGNREGKCGVKIYSMRILYSALPHDSEFLNYAIDSGNKITEILERNDIVDSQTGVITMDKLTGKVDILKVTGNIDLFFNNTGDAQINCDFERIAANPYDSVTIKGMRMKNPGQSTRGFGISQQRGYTYKDGCIIKDYNGVVINKGYYTILQTIDDKKMIPEKKFRLNPLFVDSSMGLAATFYRMVNKTYPLAVNNGNYFLRNDAQKYALEQYEKAMGYPFPYKILNVPNPIPCVEFWRPNDSANYQYLSLFTMAHEKKSPRSFGLRSIYNKILPDNTLDPFDLYDGKKGDRLWDNSNCLQFEILENANRLAYFDDSSHWFDRIIDEQGNFICYSNELVFEQEYPDVDDCTPEEIEAARAKLYDLHRWFSSCYQLDQGGPRAKAKFQAEARNHLDIYKWAAYRILMLKNMMVDNSVRNMELRTDDGIIWYPNWWDVDIQFGKRNDGPLVFKPGIDRQSRDPDNSSQFAFAGHDSWIWNAFESWDEFMNVITPVVNQALVNAGWTKKAFINEFESFIANYPERLYNLSMQSKYVDQYFNGKDYLPFMTGRMQQYVRYMVAECYNKWDAEWCSGEYAADSLYLRCGGAPNGKKMYFKAAKDFTFGWALTDTSRILQKGLKVNKGETFEFMVNLPTAGSLLGVNDPVVIYGPNALEEIDLHEMARYFSAALQFDKTYDPDLGTNLKVLNVGISKEEMATNERIPVEFNNDGEATAWQELPVRNNQTLLTYTGLDKMSRLEVFNMQGMAKINSTPSIKNMTSLKKFYAAGSNITSFEPADNRFFEEIELPDKVTSINATGLDWASLKFFDDNIHELSTIPATLTTIIIRNVGEANGAKQLFRNWVNILDDVENINSCSVTMTGVKWTGFDYTTLVKLGEMLPFERRTLTGYIEIIDSLDTDKMSKLMELYGANIFTPGAQLRISTAITDFVIGIGEKAYYENGFWNLIEGYGALLSAVAFPIKDNPNPIRWTIANERNPVYKTSEIDPITGYLNTVEQGIDTYPITISVTDSAFSKSIDMNIVKRTYPTRVRLQMIDPETLLEIESIQGLYYVNSTGYKYFRALFTVDGIEDVNFKSGGFGKYGTIATQAQWDLINAGNLANRETSRYIELNDENSIYCMKINDTPEYDVKTTLQYTVRFKNDLTLVADDINVILYKVFQVINLSENSFGGNIGLYQSLINQGVQYTGNNNSITNEDLKQYISTLTIDDSIFTYGGTDYKIKNFIALADIALPEKDVFSYMLNISGLNLEHSHINQVLDMTKYESCEFVNSQYTQNSLKIGDEN